MIREGKAIISVETPEVVSSDMPVFYNPVMVVNRDISLLIVNAMEGKDLVVCDPMGASGVRALRFLLEVPGVSKVIYNDINQKAVENFKENLRLNQVDQSRVEIYSEDATLLLRRLRNCDYVDIDPYGSPIPFLDSAIFPVKRGGILSVTATDTSVLSGTYPNTCIRRYASKPLLECEFYHEVGIRILIKKVVEEGAKHDYAFRPIFSYSYKHHFKVFLVKDIGAKRADQVVKNIGYLIYCDRCLYRESVSLDDIKSSCPFCGNRLLVAGPLWIGELWDEEFLQKVWFLRGNVELSQDTVKVLRTIKEECQIKSVGFYTLSALAKAFKIPNLPPKHKILRLFEARQTHFTPEGFRTSINHQELLRRVKDVLLRNSGVNTQA
ncbi:tRNA (guanine(10)-N(2))-dimethyltransferase [Thermocrinis sp.]